VRLEGLGKLKKVQLIGSRTRDLPACSIVPQPTTLPRALRRMVRLDYCFRYLLLGSLISGYRRLGTAAYTQAMKMEAIGSSETVATTDKTI
jgi:hypothetical protein